MRTEVMNQIQMLRNAVATEVPPRRGTHRRWLRLGPSGDGVSLLEVEVPVGADPTEHARGEEDYIVVSNEAFPSLEVALAALRRRGVNTYGFDAVFKTDNPF